MQLFYEANFALDPRLSPEEAKHAFGVLRKRVGDILHVTDGNGKIFLAKILNTSTAQLEVIEIFTPKPKGYKLALVIAPTKDPDRMEWLIEKAVEIGIDEIRFVLTNRTDIRYHQGKQLPFARWERIIVTAMKQSGGCFLPKILPLTVFKTVISQIKAEQKWVAHLDEGERKLLVNQMKSGTSQAILIGPEGDFTPEEITEACQVGFLPVSLGENRLRTETAALFGVQTAALVNQLSTK